MGRVVGLSWTASRITSLFLPAQFSQVVPRLLDRSVLLSGGYSATLYHPSPLLFYLLFSFEIDEQMTPKGFMKVRAKSPGFVGRVVGLSWTASRIASLFLPTLIRKCLDKSLSCKTKIRGHVPSGGVAKAALRECGV